MKTRLIISLLLWVGIVRIITWPITIRTADDVQIPQGTAVAPAGEISRGSVVRQTLPAPGAAIDRISVYLATYQRPMRWPLTMRLEAMGGNGTWSTFWTKTVTAEEIRDNTYYTAMISPSIVVPPAREIAVSLSSDAPPGEAASWWTSPAWTKAGFKLTLNDQALTGAAVMSLHYEKVQGPFLLLAPAAWQRLTPFLSLPWQILFFAAAVVGLGLTAYLLSRAIEREPNGE